MIEVYQMVIGGSLDSTILHVLVMFDHFTSLFLITTTEQGRMVIYIRMVQVAGVRTSLGIWQGVGDGAASKKDYDGSEI